MILVSLNKQVFSEEEKQELFERIWEINPEFDNNGTWFWWFWLFYFENKENPEKPHQLMILWSTKNEKEIYCNNKIFKFPNKIKIEKNKSSFDGVVACWYFDGEMQHNYLLEAGDMSLTKKPYALNLNSENKTSFYEKDGGFKVIINRGNKKFDFDLKMDSTDEFVKPTYSRNNYGGNYSYSGLGIPRVDFTGVISEKEKNEKVNGTAYFQYIVVNAPVPSWYWGHFHFKEGSILSYFNPHIGPAILKGNLTKRFIEKGNISLGDNLTFANKKSGKKEQFKVKKVKNKKNSEGYPLFLVYAENKEAKLYFEVDCYAGSYWEFDKKTLGHINTRLRYNEYPSKVKNLVLTDKKGKELVTSKEIGEGNGNAEHSWGLLI